MAFEGITGHTGEVRVGGRVAARLTSWSATRNPSADTWTIGAGVAECVEAWLAGTGPFELRLDVGKAPWRWRGVELERGESGGLTITAHGRFER